MLILVTPPGGVANALQAVQPAFGSALTFQREKSCPALSIAKTWIRLSERLPEAINLNGPAQNALGTLNADNDRQAKTRAKKIFFMFIFLLRAFKVDWIDRNQDSDTKGIQYKNNNTTL